MEALLEAFSQTATLSVILWSALGAVIGIITGALPGLTATMGMALMLPIVFQLPMVEGVALLLSVYAGSVSGASIPAILLGIPGNPNAIATIEDGLEMTRKGMAGQALGAAAIASFIGGVGSLLFLVLFAPLLASLTLRFGPAELAALYLFGLTIIISVSGKNLLKGLVAGIIGVMLGLFGTDPFTNVVRLPFADDLARTPLSGGISLIPALIGVYGISQVFWDLERMKRGAQAVASRVKLGKVFPPFRKLAQMWRIIAESLGIGTIIGAIPGTGASIAVFLAHDRAKKVTSRPGSKHGKIGTGVVEGVVAPEVTNNAVTGGAIVPVLSLGIPGDAATAVLLGALLVKGIVPGYQLFANDLVTVYSVYLALLAANIFMVTFQLLGVRLYPHVLRVPTAVLMPVVAVLSLVGAFAIRGQAALAGTVDMGIALGLGILAYFLRKAGYPLAPIVLGLILGGPFESSLRRALQLSRGDVSIFFTEPIALVLVLLSVASLSLPFVTRLIGRMRRDRADGRT